MADAEHFMVGKFYLKKLKELNKSQREHMSRVYHKKEEMKAKAKGESQALVARRAATKEKQAAKRAAKLQVPTFYYPC